MTTLTDRATSRGLFRDRSRAARASLSTVPIVIASSLAMSMNLTGPIVVDTERATDRDDSDSRSHLRENVRAAFAGVSAKSEATASTPEGDFAFAAAPATYTVKDGDSVSGIAGRFGLSTATVLAMNGLGWKSIIHPGQVLMLSKTAAPVAATPTARSASVYTIAAGDTVSGIAAKFGVSAKAVLSANGLSAQSIIYPGQKLTIPGSSSVASATPTAAPTPAATNHTVVSGETATSIAQRHGVSLGALLSANGLTASSTIYAGQSLVIPSVQPAGTVPAAADVVVPMTPEMAGHARTIVGVGRSLGVDDYGLVIALAAAAQESTLRNLDWGDLDSVGLFQQRPSAGWGTVAQLTTPDYAARLFFGGPNNPNAGVTRGLLDIPGWRGMTVTQAAQAVQISAFPDAYAKWETSARAWLAQLS
ncbi:LysM peptidoglycan-binding domain-containing protein [Salinibacterium sp. GXW1014]|uniref:LysM peptidoglycan-binding domain-containing protein n=1 Tax=Salinibacterium sp. GXW1014 TaxID=3377838 RepID=UPI00383BB209